MIRSPRILLFSHDSYGLGHLRRTLNIGRALTETFSGANVLVASGSPCATHFEVPHGLDIIKLPSATKNSAGRYVPRSLDCDLDFLIKLRRGIMREVQRSFEPDLLIVDHRVLGLGDELDELLEAAGRAGTRMLLGIRDIIDEPEAVAREWGTESVREALRDRFDRVCVYGAPEVFDPRVEYPIPPELGQRLEFTGYIVRPAQPQPPRSVPSLRPEVLVTVGGGEDGAERVETYLEALELAPAPWHSTVVLGPLLDSERARQIKRRARLLDGVTVHRFHGDMPRLLHRASAVVSMAGYNTVAEVLQSRTPAVLCPRTFPRREQLIRATRLSSLGLVRCLPRPSALSMRAAVEAALADDRKEGELPPLPPMDGATRLCEIVRELLPGTTARLEMARMQTERPRAVGQ